MTYEGNRQIIAFRGIERARTDNKAEQGAMEEVINMLPRNGSYRPYKGKGINVPYINGASMIRVHKTSNGDNIIIVKYDGNIYWGNKDKYESGEEEYSLITDEYNGGEIRDLHFMGNILIIEGTNKIRYFTFRDTNDGLNYEITESGTQHKKLPSISFKVDAGIFDGSNTYGSYRARDWNDAASEHDRYSDEEAKNILGNSGLAGLMMQALGEARSSGGITGYVVVGCAYHLRNSSSDVKYVQAGPLVLLGAPERYRRDEHTFRIKSQIPTIEEEEIITDSIIDGSDILEPGIINIQAMADNLSNISLDDKSADKLVENNSCQLIQGGDSVKRIRLPYVWGTKYLRYNSDFSNNHWHLLSEAYAVGNVLKYKISEDIDESMRNTYDKVSIFMSRIIPPYKELDESNNQNILNTGDEYNDCRIWSFTSMNTSMFGSSSFIPKMKTMTEISDEIKSIVTLYKIKDIDFDDIKSSGWIDVDLSGGRLESYEQTEDILPVSSFYNSNTETVGSVFLYNRRLHLYDNKTIRKIQTNYESSIYNGGDGQDYSSDYRNVVGRQGFDYIDIIYHIVVELRNGSRSVDTFTSDKLCLNGLLTIANSDAKSITIIKKARAIKNGIIGWYKGNTTFDEIRTTYGGELGCVLTSDLSPLDIELAECSLGEWMQVPNEILSDDDNINHSNQVKYATDSDTIAIGTNQQLVGNGKIIGMARMGISMSQDNFGNYPLICFCTDGVYALGVDTTGETVYTTCTPVSRMTCISREMICEIDSGIVFGTEMGLVLLSADGVNFITTLINGEPKNKPQDDMSKGSGLYIYKNSINHPQLTELNNAISQEDFIKYINIEGCKLSFLPKLNSILCYNPTKGYHYLIDLTTLMAVKINEAILFEDGNYPEQRFYTELDMNNFTAIIQCINFFDVKVNKGEKIPIPGGWRYNFNEYFNSLEEGTHYYETSNLQFHLTHTFNGESEDIVTTMYGNAVGIFKPQGRWRSGYRFRINIIKSHIWHDRQDDSQVSTGSELENKLNDTQRLVARNYRGVLRDIMVYSDGSADVYYSVRGSADVLVWNIDANDIFNSGDEGNYERISVLNNVEVEYEDPLMLGRGAQIVNVKSLVNAIGSEGKYEIKSSSDNTSFARKIIVNGTIEIGEDELEQYGISIEDGFSRAGGDRIYVVISNSQPSAIEFKWDSAAGDIQCLLTTRAMQISEELLKSSLRVVIRGRFKSYSGGENKLGMYVLGSLDSEHWHPIGFKEKSLSEEGFSDIGCITDRVSEKYLMIILTGKISNECYVDGLEITSKGKYENKLK